MINIELVYDKGCPNVEETRRNLRIALEQLGISPEWTEWDRASSSSPPRARLFGSPTILVNGNDVSDASPTGEANCCRFYADESGSMRGVPSVKTIMAAVLKFLGKSDSLDTHGSHRGRLLSILVTIPGILVGLLPSVTCPACLPLYAAVLGWFGLGFVNYTPYLFPLTLVSLALLVFSLGFRARNRRGYKPFYLGIVGSILIMVGKFVLYYNLMMYGGIILLVTASAWNGWSLKKGDKSSCTSCTPHETQQLLVKKSN